ncbi:MAG: DNA polymerase III subunit gamma/tau [Bacilli bacterium]|nr:DNA polymerase III subunit gamma/tau [Bacilli bacterium]
MEHLAMYRKYRPSNFDEVSGQKTVVSVLKNAIKNNSVSHAYLFTGPRGTGKTSVAKIFARTINCGKPEQNNPCNKCVYCENSFSKECVDIIEIDAASNNGVDEIRELKSKINIVPSLLKYKVYIIDEVHMLSIGAFNALLKTLEEPPSHAIFILATTELHKVPATILSRCQVLEFKKISPNDMKNKILDICSFEKINATEEAIKEIVNCSDGCMRDALSLLEKMTAYCNKDIAVEEVRVVCGKPEKTSIQNLIESVKNNDINDVFKKINYFYENDYDMLSIVGDIINQLEQLIFINNKIDTLYLSILSEFVEIYDKMKTSSVDKKILFEIGILNFYKDKEEKNISREIFSRTKIEQQKQGDDCMSIEKDDKRSMEKQQNVHDDNIDLVEFKSVRINNAFVSASKDLLHTAKEMWEMLKEYAFDKNKGSEICILLDGTPVMASPEYIVLLYQYSSVADKVNAEYMKLEQVINEMLNYNCHIVAVDNEDWSNAKGDYIKKINSGEKYLLLDDKYFDGVKEKSVIINNIESNISSENDTEKKMYDLFDSNYIEIK